MKIAIVNQHFNIGGVETFLLSLIRQFLKMGNEVDVFLLEPGESNHLLPDLLSLGVRVGSIQNLGKAKSRRNFDALLVTNPQTLFEAARLIHLGRVEVGKLIVCAYQTRMYCLDRGPLNLHNRLTRWLFLKHIPVANVVFGNDACRDEHVRFAPSMQNAPVIPLIVDGERFFRRPMHARSTPIRIVSVGRLDHFKTYNQTMLDVMARLRTAGHEVIWDVYGSGPLGPQMQHRIKALGLQSDVVMHGNANYADLPAILQGAFVFVGSGLSMMEAASTGVPAIPAIEYCKKPESFGFVHDIPGISFFEPGLKFARRDIGDLILELLALSTVEYERIGDQNRKKMSVFFADAVARQFVETIQSASTVKPCVPLLTYHVYKTSACAYRIGSKWLRRLPLRKG